ncbi:ABC transporter related protein [Dehalogenimonas lykanthroporepellens BL-DC-9]|nr:ABC transporter related protein [Dehalogenimonas lykanthroporepellens BL-DC-9]
MPTVKLTGINKTYGAVRVVNDVSFEVDGGEIFALIGPNGAGKSTTIRMMMDIIKPDSGDIVIMNEHLGEAGKNRIGYLPEERGLYRKLKIMDTVAYLASLKGAEPADAIARAEAMLKTFGLFEHRYKKIEELSKGMGQLTQFVVTVAHNPDLIILDEPFAGLDPVNSRLLKDTVRGLRAEGKAVILSTHRMNEVEEMCDRLFMINKGREVLYGRLDDIRRRFRAHAAVVESLEPVPDNIPGVIGRQVNGRVTELQLDAGTSPQQLLSSLVAAGHPVERFEVATPSLDEIFVRVVNQP